MRYMKTLKGNYIVEDISTISLKHKDAKITRYAFFNSEYKFIKLTEYIVWRQIQNSDSKVYIINEGESESFMFNFPKLFSYHFVEEARSKDNHLLRMFYRWTVSKNKILPTISIFAGKRLILEVKYDIFIGKILENEKVFRGLISEKRNATFPNWTKFLLFNCWKNYKLDNEKNFKKFSL